MLATIMDILRNLWTFNAFLKSSRYIPLLLVQNLEDWWMNSSQWEINESAINDNLRNLILI